MNKVFLLLFCFVILLNAQEIQNFEEIKPEGDSYIISLSNNEAIGLYSIFEKLKNKVYDVKFPDNSKDLFLKLELKRIEFDQSKKVPYKEPWIAVYEITTQLGIQQIHKANIYNMGSTPEFIKIESSPKGTFFSITNRLTVIWDPEIKKMIFYNTYPGSEWKNRLTKKGTYTLHSIQNIAATQENICKIKKQTWKSLSSGIAFQATAEQSSKKMLQGEIYIEGNPFFMNIGRVFLERVPGSMLKLKLGLDWTTDAALEYKEKFIAGIPELCMGQWPKKVHVMYKKWNEMIGGLGGIDPGKEEMMICVPPDSPDNFFDSIFWNAEPSVMEWNDKKYATGLHSRLVFMLEGLQESFETGKASVSWEYTARMNWTLNIQDSTSFDLGAKSNIYDQKEFLKVKFNLKK